MKTVVTSDQSTYHIDSEIQRLITEDYTILHIIPWERQSFNSAYDQSKQTYVQVLQYTEQLFKVVAVKELPDTLQHKYKYKD